MRTIQGSVIKTDLYRAFTSIRFPAAILVVFCVNLLTEGVAQQCADVLSQFVYLKWKSAYIMVFFFAGISFSGTLLEDQERGFMKLQIMRVGEEMYVRGRVFSCFFLSATVTALGTALYLFRLCFRRNTELTSLALELCQGSFWGWFALHGQPVVYYAGTVLIMSMFAGILSLAAMLAASESQSYLMAYTVPVAGYYFIINWITDGKSTFLDFGSIFLQCSNVIMGNAVWSFLYTCSLLIAAYLCFAYLIHKSVCRKMEGRGDEKNSTR